jgi:hypothetical protein
MGPDGELPSPQNNVSRTYTQFWICIQNDLNISVFTTTTISVAIKALCNKMESRGFETRWGEWIVSIYVIFPAALGPGVHSDEYQKPKNNVSVEQCVVGA